MSFLKVENLSAFYGKAQALTDVDLHVEQGEIIAIVGANGAGKSTLFKMIASFTPTTSGEVIYQGERISNLKPHIVARKGVVRTFQETTIFKSMTVRESVVVAQHLRAKASLAGYFWGSKTAKEDVTAFGKYADELLEFLGMSEISNEQASNLPQGSLRALGIAIGLATDPKVLLLDEPFAGMNHDETMNMVNLVRSVRDERGVTVMLVEHDMPAVMNISDRIVVLNFGEKIAEGTPSEIQNNEKVIETYLGSVDDEIGM